MNVKILKLVLLSVKVIQLKATHLKVVGQKDINPKVIEIHVVSLGRWEGHSSITTRVSLHKVHSIQTEVGHTTSPHFQRELVDYNYHYSIYQDGVRSSWYTA